MRADELAAPSGDTFKFEAVGDTVEGQVTYVGDWQTQINKFNGNNEEVARIGMNTGNGEVVYVWPRRGSPMAQAIAEALREAGVNELAEGQTLKLRFDSEKDTGKPQKMKMYRAKIIAGEAPQQRPTEEPF